MTAPPTCSPPLPSSSRPGFSRQGGLSSQGRLSRHGPDLGPSPITPHDRRPRFVRSAPCVKSGGWIPGAAVTGVTLSPAPPFPPIQFRLLPRAGAWSRGPGPLKLMPRPAPAQELRHFRRVRLASGRRGMAALRSWLSRSVSSFFRYRCGRVEGPNRRRGGDAKSSMAGTAAPAMQARASLGRAGRGVPPLSEVRGRPAPARAGGLRPLG